MKAKFEVLRSLCPVCDGDCGLSIELLEFMVRASIDGDAEPLDDLDRMVREAVEGEHKHEAHFSEPRAPFPIGLDIEGGSIVFIAWCFTCKATRMISLTPMDLVQLLRNARGGSDESTD